MAYIDLDEINRLRPKLTAKYPLSFANGISAAIGEINKLPNADVVPKSGEGTECPTCHGTGRIGTTDWLTKNISKKQLAEEKAKAIAEHEQYIKTELAREIFAEIESKKMFLKDCVGNMGVVVLFKDISELKKKYTEETK